jgi:hypothetical protein
MPLMALLAMLMLSILTGPVPACALEDQRDLQLSGNEYRIVVPRVGSMDSKVYPVEPQQYKPECPRRDRDLRPSPDTGYGTPGSPLVSPGQTIPGRFDNKRDP